MRKKGKALSDLGDMIKEHRLKAKLTQKELGERIKAYDSKGRAESTVAGWERGHGRVPRDLLPALSSILNIPIEDLLRKAGILQETPASRVERILEDAGFSYQDLEDDIDLILMILKKKR